MLTQCDFCPVVVWSFAVSSEFTIGDNRQVQHEFADSHQTPSTLLGWTRESLEMSRTTVVEMAPALLERDGERQVGRTASKTTQNLQMGGYCVDRGIQSLWECRWFCSMCTTIDRMATIC